MGAQLGAADIGTVRPGGARPSTAALDGSGLAQGMQAIGQAVVKHDQQLDAQADKQAAAHEMQFLQSYEPAREERAAVYTGDQPGYSGQELTAYDAAADEYRKAPDLDPRVSRLLNERLDARRLSVGTNAAQYEGAKRAQINEQTRVLKQNADDVNAYMPILQAAQDVVRSTQEAWDGKSEGLTDKTVAAFDEATKPMLDGIEDQGQRNRLGLQLANMRTNLVSQSMAAEDKGQHAYIIDTATKTQQLGTNMVLADPEGSYQSAGLLLDQAASALPVAMREPFVREGKQQLLVARLSGLTDMGKTDQVTAELKANEALLTPQQFAHIQGDVQNAVARKQATDYVAQSAMDNQVSAYIDGIMAGDNRGARPDDAAVRATLGEKGLFEFRQKETAAKSARVALGDLPTQTPEQMAQRVAALQAAAVQGGPDYELKKSLAVAGAQAMQAQIKARQEDPAGWAMNTAGAPNGPASVVRSAWLAIGQAPDAASRQAAIATYARATDAYQRSVGITSTRLLPQSDAKAMVQAVAGAPEDQRGDALFKLVNDVNSFGQYRGQAINDLKTAGLSGEIGVVVGELNSHPALVRAYADGGAPLKAMKPKERDGFMGDVRKAMSKFDQSSIGPYGSPQVQQDRYGMVARVAAGLHAQGDTEAHAIQTAARQYADDYTFVGTWRVDKAWGQQKAGTFGAAVLGEAYPNNISAMTAGAKAIRNGISGVGNHPVGQWGEGVSRLSDNQTEAQEKALAIRAQGRWITRPDDSGLMLVIPNQQTGIWETVRNKDGSEISYSKDELVKIGNYSRGEDYFDERAVLSGKVK